jgi:type VI secretion system secreted protein VgrG
LGTFTQANRPIRIKTALGNDDLLLAGFTARETISEPFEIKVQLFSENGTIDPTTVLRKPATVTVVLATGDIRYFNGVFRDFAQGGFDDRSHLYTYEGTIVPSLWLLSLGWNCKIFQNMAVPDIVQAVLKASGVTSVSLSLNGTYSEREYCVQYRESNLNFISRLLEEEGISYYFVHSESDHKLTLSDSTPSAPSCTEDAVSYSATAPEGTPTQSTIWSLSRTDQVFTPKVALTDYYFETPSLSLLDQTQTISKNTGPEEKFDYPGGYRTNSDGTRYGKLRIEELETPAMVVHGESNCASFCSGLQFTMSDHYRDEMNQAYLLLSVAHKATIPNYVGSENEEFSYENRYQGIPLKVPFRPPRVARKPVVAGSQTAVVVGTSGEEIYVDKYGRVKVQFFWDRDGKKDENSSCWIRVSQIWAGKNWGWVTLPRIGQEVVVDFLEGDPDRPLIVGRIYNAEQMPPYTLPDKSTQSGIKTRSSKGGSGSNANEIRFEDLSGSEDLFIHAEKDMHSEVEHDDSQLVQNDRTIEVDGKHTETITKDTTITIKEGNLSLTLNQGNQSTTLDQGNQSTKISLGSASHEAMQQIELKVGQSSIVLTQQGITIKGLMISIQGTVQLEAKAPMTTVSADALLTLKGGITMIN